MKAKKTKRNPKYRYEVSVTETVVSTTVIESERKLSYGEVKGETETRRTHGKLSVKGVTDVDMWIDNAYKDGKELHDDIFAH